MVGVSLQGELESEEVLPSLLETTLARPGLLKQLMLFSNYGRTGKRTAKVICRGLFTPRKEQS